MKRITVLLAALTAMVALPGCWFTGAYWTGDDDDVTYDYDDGWRDPSARTVTFERLDGELGGHTVALAAVQGSAYAGTGTSLEVETIQDGSWVLFRLDVQGDLYDPSFEGARVYSSVDGGADLMGCTGDAPYEFDYDGYATDVEVEVTQGDLADTRRVSFTATFDEGLRNRVVTGSVIVDLAQADETPWRDPGYGDTRTYSATWEGVESDLGDEGAYSLSTASGSGYSDGYYSSVEFESTAVGQWILFRLSFYDADLYSAQVGDVLEGGDLMGCTGPSPGSFDFDGHTSDVEVQILPGSNDNERIARVVGTWDTEWGPQSFEGDVRYEVY